MKKTNITTEDILTLNKNLTEKREELRTARFSLGAEGKNTKAIRDLRHGVARILTELTRRSRQA